MAVRFKSSANYWTTVNFQIRNEAGKLEAMSFDAQFKRMSSAELSDLTAAGEKDSVLLPRVLLGWKLKDMDTGEDVPFTEQTLAEFVQIPGAASVTMARFIATVIATREGN